MYKVSSEPTTSPKPTVSSANCYESTYVHYEPYFLTQYLVCSYRASLDKLQSEVSFQLLGLEALFVSRLLYHVSYSNPLQLLFVLSATPTTAAPTTELPSKSPTPSPSMAPNDTVTAAPPNSMSSSSSAAGGMITTLLVGVGGALWFFAF